MALIGNRSVLHKSPGRFLSGTVASGDRSNFNKYGMMRNRYEVLDDMSAIPTGALAPIAWVLPKIAGGMGSWMEGGTTVSATASGTSGFPIYGDAAINVSFADAAGQLISSGTGSANIVIAFNSPLLTASMSGTGSSSFSVLTNSPVLGAKASVIGTSSIAVSANLIPYATGSMSGSTVDSNTLTTDAISAAVWEYVDRTLTAASSSSLTTEEHDQLMKTLTTSKFLGLK